MGKILTNSQGKAIIANGNAFEVTAAVDSNIVAGNIKKDVEILGVTGTYEGGGGISLTGYTEGAVVSIQPTVQVSSPSYTIPNPLSITPKVIVGVMKGDISGRSGCSGPFMVALTQCTGQTSPQQAIMGGINNGDVSSGGTVSVAVNADDTLTISLRYYDHPNYGWDVIILG